MSLTSSWLSDVETIVVSAAVEHPDRTKWRYDGKPTATAWDQFPFLGICTESFECAIEVITEATDSNVSKYQVFVCRYAFSESFEKAHSIGIRLTVKQGDQVLHAEDKYSWSWYSDIPCTKPFTPGGEEGRRLHKISNSTTTMSNTFKEDLGFTIFMDVQITESGVKRTRTETFADTVLLSLGDKLKEPNCTDVEFNFPDEEEPNKLYGMSTLLELRSTYFKTMLNSRFAEGGGNPIQEMKPGVNGFKDATPLRPHRHIVNLPDDYDLFHTILYYLYTDRICFTTDLDSCHAGPYATDDAEGIYGIAHRLLISPLLEKCLKFLADTCSPQNIMARAFGKVAATYEAVGKTYQTYLLEHWNEVIKDPSFEEFFAEVEGDKPEVQRVNALLRELVRCRGETEAANAEPSK